MSMIFFMFKMIDLKKKYSWNIYVEILQTICLSNDLPTMCILGI